MSICSPAMRGDHVVTQFHLGVHIIAVCEPYKRSTPSMSTLDTNYLASIKNKHKFY